MTIFKKIKKVTQAIKEFEPEIIERLRAIEKIQGYKHKIEEWWFTIEMDGTGSIAYLDRWKEETHIDFELFLNDNWQEVIEEKQRKYKEFQAEIAKKNKLNKKQLLEAEKKMYEELKAKFEPEAK